MKDRELIGKCAATCGVDLQWIDVDGGHNDDAFDGLVPWFDKAGEVWNPLRNFELAMRLAVAHGVSIEHHIPDGNPGTVYATLGWALSSQPRTKEPILPTCRAVVECLAYLAYHRK